MVNRFRRCPLDCSYFPGLKNIYADSAGKMKRLLHCVKIYAYSRRDDDLISQIKSRQTTTIDL